MSSLHERLSHHPVTPLERLLGILLSDLAFRMIPVTYNGLENLKAVRTLVEQKQQVVFATNHISHLDPVLEARLMQHALAGVPHTLSYFASAKFFDNRLSPLITAIGHGLAWRDNYLLVPTIQENDTSYDTDSRQSFNRRSFATYLKPRLRDNQKPAVIGIAPEGSRSDTGTLLPALEGVDSILQRVQVLVLFAVQGTNRIFSKSDAYNPRAKASITISPPISTKEFLDRPGEPHHNVMMQIATLLPQDMWGAYARVMAEQSPDSHSTNRSEPVREMSGK